MLRIFPKQPGIQSGSVLVVPRSTLGRLQQGGSNLCWTASTQSDLNWVRQHAQNIPKAARYSVGLRFGGSSVNIGEIATGRVKSMLDCLYPVRSELGEATCSEYSQSSPVFSRAPFWWFLGQHWGDCNRAGQIYAGLPLPSPI